MSEISSTTSSHTTLLVRRIRVPALIFLLVLATCLAEFLTGSTPPLRMFTNPIVFLENLGLYGCGSILIREVAIIWRKRWGAILLLGGAYAVGEEGFAAKTMTDPLGSPVGNQLYNHFAGINWVPLSSLTLFHSVFSIGVPLLLLELMLPETKNRRLTGKPGFVTVMLAYGFTVLILSLKLGNPYSPQIYATVFLAGYALSFLLSAYYVPRSFLQAKQDVPTRGELGFVLSGIGFMGAFFLISIFGRLLPWPLQALLFLVPAIVTARFLVRNAGKNGNEIAKICFIIGMFLVFVPIDIILELGGDTAVLVFTGLMLAFAFYLRSKILQRRNATKFAPEGSSSNPLQSTSLMT